MIKSSYCYPGCHVVPILKEFTKHIPVITPFISNHQEQGVREAPLKKTQGLFGHWFGALILRRIVHVQRGICLVWGVRTLARMVWGTYAVKIEVQMVFAQVGPEIKCPRVPV